jgi:hypothetical protein
MSEPIEIYRKEVAQRILIAQSGGGWESTHTDFKRELGTKQRDFAKLLKHVLAFANTPRRTDAYIIFGVEEDKERNVFTHVGVSEGGFPSPETVEQILHDYTKIKDSYVDSHYLLDGKRTPYIVIPLQYEGPHSLTRTINAGPGAVNPTEIYCRYGSRSVRANERDVSRMRSDWATWFLDCRYEKNASSLTSLLAKRFSKRIYLKDIGPCVRLIYNSTINDEFGSNEFPVLVHAYWGFDRLEPDAVAKIVNDNSPPTLRKTLIGARFTSSAHHAADAAMVQCIPLDEIYFVHDPYAQLCREFLRQWADELSSRHLSYIVDLDFRLAGKRADVAHHPSILAYLDDQLRQEGRTTVLVHGAFGGGKTTTARRLVADLYDEYLRGNTAVPKVLYLNVNNIDIRSRRDECIENELARYRLKRDVITDLVVQVERDELNLIFDGVDEMARPYTAVGRKDAIQILRDVGNRRTAIYFVRSSYYPELNQMISDFSLLADHDFKKGEKRTVAAEILQFRQQQMIDYLDSRLGPEDGRFVRSTLHDTGLVSFLSDPLIISLVADLVEDKGIEALQAFPKQGRKAHFLGYLVDELLEREQLKRQRHGALEHFGLFQRVLRSVAFSMICRGSATISPTQLDGFVSRALENVSTGSTEAVDAFRTMAWIHRSEDGAALGFRHEALTLVCAAQHVCMMLEGRDAFGVADWQHTSPLAEVVCRYAGETINSLAVLGAMAMLGGDLQFNVRQLLTAVLEAAKGRTDLDEVSIDQLEERFLADICRGVAKDLRLSLLPIRILLKALHDKRNLQITIVLLWILSQRDSPDIVESAFELLHPIVKKDWNFCDELRTVKGDPTCSFDSMLLKDLGITPGDLMDALSYEPLFRRMYSTVGIDTPTKQYADRTLRGIEGKQALAARR